MRNVSHHAPHCLSRTSHCLAHVAEYIAKEIIDFILRALDPGLHLKFIAHFKIK